MSEEATLDEFTDTQTSEGQKETPIGDLPIDWGVEWLKDMVRINPDGFSEDSWPSETFEYISLSEASDGKIQKSKTTRLENAPSRAQRTVQEGDVLVGTVRPKQRSHGFVTEEHGGNICSSGFGVLRAGTRLNSQYLLQEILSNRFFSQMEAYVAGSGYPAVKISDLKKHRVAIPSLSEQRKIATILYTVDQVIEKTEEIVEQKKRIRTGLLQDLFTGADSNFTKSVRLSAVDTEVPEHWKVKTVGEVSTQITDGAHLTPERSEDGYLLLSARNVKNGYLDLSDVDYVPEEEYERLIEKCDPQPGDILISCSGTVGRVCEVPEDLQFALVRSAALVKFDNSVLPSYAEKVLQSVGVQKQIKGYQTQSAQPNLFQGQIASLEIPIPPIEEQRDIAEKLDIVMSSIDFNQEYQSQLKRVKQALLQDLLSGTVRTTDTNIEVPDEIAQHG